MEKLVLKESYRQKIISDPELQGKIAKATNKSIQTVRRWAETSHEMLLLSPLLDVLRSYLKINHSEILTEATDQAAPKNAAEKAVT